MGELIDLSKSRARFLNTVAVDTFAKNQPELKTWKELQAEVKGLADFLTDEEEAEIRIMEKKGTLPPAVNIDAVTRYVNYCNIDVLGPANDKRREVGLPVLRGEVLTNAIMGDRWMREKAALPAWLTMTSSNVYTDADRPTTGDWGHIRDQFIRERLHELFNPVCEALDSGKAIPCLQPATEYFTFRDADRNPYGYAYNVRLMVPDVIAGMTLDGLIDRAEDIAALAWRGPDISDVDRPRLINTVVNVLKAIADLEDKPLSPEEPSTEDK